MDKSLQCSQGPPFPDPWLGKYTPHNPEVCGHHWGWGQSHPRVALATSMACQLPGARKAPTSRCHVWFPPEPESMERSVHRGGGHSDGPSFVETDTPTPQTTPHAAPPHPPSTRAPLSGTELSSFQASRSRHLQVCSAPSQPGGSMRVGAPHP